MTLAKNWPEITLPMAHHVWENDMTRENWHTYPDIRAQIVAQFNRIAGYVERGFIAEVDIARINRQAQKRQIKSLAPVQSQAYA